MQNQSTPTSYISTEDAQTHLALPFQFSPDAGPSPAQGAGSSGLTTRLGRLSPTLLGINPASAAFPWPAGKINRIAAYCRVSLEVEHTGSHTFETQQQAIQDWALARYGQGHYSIEWFWDDGISGAVGSHGPSIPGTGCHKVKVRRRLRQCREALQAGQADTLVVFSLNRLGRNTSLVLDIVENDIVARGLGFRAISEGDSADPYNPSGKMLLTMLAGTHAFQREEISQRCLAAKVTAHKTGYFTGKPCFGWRLGQTKEEALRTSQPWGGSAGSGPPAGLEAAVSHDTSSQAQAAQSEADPAPSPRQSGDVQANPTSTSTTSQPNQGRPRPRLFQHPEEAALVRQMHQWFLSGWALNRIVTHLNERGVPTPTNLPHWQVSTVRRILFNPIHAGLVRMKGDVRQGEHFERRLFDAAEHEELLRLFATRCKTQPTNTGRSTNTYSLTGLAVCGHCGSRLYVASPQTRSSVALNCHKRQLHHQKGWEMPRVYHGTVEAFVEAQVRALVDSPLMQGALDVAAQQALSEEQGRLLCEQGRLQELIGQKQRQTQRLLGLYTNEAIDEDTFREQQALIQGERQVAYAALEQVEQALANRTAHQHQQGRLRQALLSFNEMWPHLDADERRGVLGLLIEKLEVWKEEGQTRVRLKLHLRPEVEAPLVRAPRPSKQWKRHPQGPGGVQRLTPRQLALLHWYSKELTFAQMGAQMAITVSTIRTLVSEVRHLLGVHELDEALALAAPRLKAELATLPLGPDRNHGPKGVLTPSEVHVLRFLAQGAKPAEIAQESGLSINTVRNYQDQIYKALDAHTVFQAVKRAHELKLLS
ncbi:hypothetical protein IAD21_06455 (plasmid) [Abditibacteriota bacterium]|nr:hypothetical protein IAD21_06455 [Abditibacteriota bacterium]